MKRPLAVPVGASGMSVSRETKTMTSVLIVDDKQNSLFALERILQPLEVHLIKASSGDEALRAALNNDFALAILDVQMPGMDGYELADLLRSDSATRDVPIIFLSAAHSTAPDVFRGYASGAVDFITKPFNPEILLSKVRVFLALHAQKSELAGQKAKLLDLVFQLEEQIQARRQAEDCLREANEVLEQKVAARTADLAETVDALKTANEQLVARANQLRALAGELTMAEHRQRQHLSRILHDGLQQHLAIAKLQLNNLAAELKPAELRQTADRIEGLIGESIQISRSLSAELSPPILHEGGLTAGLEWLAAWMPDKHGLVVELVIDGRPDLPEDVNILLFESIRELLFNAVKHAGVSRAWVHLQQTGEGDACIRVQDDGAGFDVRSLEPAGNPGTGFGLFSIRERIGLIGGRLQIDSNPGEGSCFTLMVPVRTCICGRKSADGPTDRKDVDALLAQTLQAHSEN
jgi:signal transduction histidine kinase